MYKKIKTIVIPLLPYFLSHHSRLLSCSSWTELKYFLPSWPPKMPVWFIWFSTLGCSTTESLPVCVHHWNTMHGWKEVPCISFCPGFCTTWRQLTQLSKLSWQRQLQIQRPVRYCWQPRPPASYQGAGAEGKHARIISPEQENALWAEGILGSDNPKCCFLPQWEELLPSRLN